MSYMSNAEFAPASGIQELTFNEIDYVGGGDGARGNSTAGGAAAARGAAIGARIGVSAGVAGPVAAAAGVVAGAVVGGAIGYVAHRIGSGE